MKYKRIIPKIDLSTIGAETELNKMCVGDVCMGYLDKKKYYIERKE